MTRTAPNRPLLLLALLTATACHPAAKRELRPEPASSALTAGLGLPFSEVVRAGDMLYLSGMIGIRPGSMELVPGGLDAEARQTMDNIRAMLESAGASLDDVVRCLVMLEDMSHWSRFNAIWIEYFGEHRPARSAIGGDGLALGAAVEVECIAVAPRS